MPWLRQSAAAQRQQLPRSAWFREGAATQRLLARSSAVTGTARVESGGAEEKFRWRVDPARCGSTCNRRREIGSAGTLFGW